MNRRTTITALVCSTLLAGLAAPLAAQGIKVNLGTPAAAQAFVEGQMDTWAKVVKDHQITAD